MRKRAVSKVGGEGDEHQMIFPRREASQRAETVANLKQATISPEGQGRIPVFIRYGYRIDVLRDLHAARPPEIWCQRDSCITAWEVSKKANRKDFLRGQSQSNEARHKAPAKAFSRRI